MTNVFGYISFSYFGGVGETPMGEAGGAQDRFEWLYAPARMNDRFHFFENLTLPSLRSQRDADFRVLALASQVMPDAYKTRLTAAVADIPQIDVLFSDAAHIHDAIDPWIADNPSVQRGKTLHFRLEDDDAISADTIAMARDVIDRAKREALVTFPRGFLLACDNGIPHLLRSYKMFQPTGRAFVNRPGQIRNPFRIDVSNQFRAMPTIMDPRPFTYIHVANATSDTRRFPQSKIHRMMKDDPGFGKDRWHAQNAQIIRESFPCFTVDELKEIVASVHDGGGVSDTAS